MEPNARHRCGATHVAQGGVSCSVPTCMPGCTRWLPVGRAHVLCTRLSPCRGWSNSHSRGHKGPQNALPEVYHHGPSRAEPSGAGTEEGSHPPHPSSTAGTKEHLRSHHTPHIAGTLPSGDPCRPHTGHNWCPDWPPPSTHEFPWLRAKQPPRPQESQYTCHFCTKPVALPP